MNRWITWILIFTAIIFLSTFIPIYVRSTRFDTTRQDILLHHGFMEDYETYLSAINQGQHGSLFWTDPHHLNPLLPVPLFTVFTIAGFLTAPFHMWPPYVYHLLRALGIAAMILSTYALF